MNMTCFDDIHWTWQGQFIAFFFENMAKLSFTERIVSTPFCQGQVFQLGTKSFDTKYLVRSSNYIAYHCGRKKLVIFRVLYSNFLV